MLVTWCCKVSS